MLNTGKCPRLSVEPLRESHLETLNDFTSRMERATDEACLALTQAADYMAQFYDAHHRDAPLYEIGDQVCLNGQNITMTQPTKNWITNGLAYIQSKKSSCGMHTPSSYPHPLAEPTQSSQ